VNTGREFIVVMNGSGGDRTLTIELHGVTVDGQAPEDKVVTVENGNDMTLVGPLNPTFYNYTTAVPLPVGDAKGKTFFKFDSVTNVTVAVVKLGEYVTRV
jgi:hypothetical protein